MFPQRRNVEVHHLDPVHQILAEQSAGNSLGQIAIRGRDHAHVDVHARAGGTHSLNLAVLEEAEQDGLHLQAHFADFVQENGAVMRQLEAPWFVAIRTGEAASRVPEQFRFEQCVGECGAVHRDKGPSGARRACVNVLRDQILADAAFPGEEDLGVARGHACSGGTQLPHRRTGTDDDRVSIARSYT